jgi:hypothetical protein
MRVNRRGNRNISGRNNEQGVIILLVAVFMLFVVGAMAALAIDVVTLYTARSEAQLAADSGALAGARVLANSGMTSDPTGGLTANAEINAAAVATQAATHNSVGGARLVNAQVTVTFTNDAAPPYNPRITVQIQVSTLPTFFARIWGNQQLAVAASATAEAYNPTGAGAVGAPPVAPVCVKPWLLPNIDPTSPPATPTTIFDPTTGAITNAGLLGYTTPAAPGSTRLELACGDLTTANPANCAPPMPAPLAWQYYPGNDDPTSFPHPTSSLPSCSLIPTLSDYQKSIAGCIQVPIACNSQVNIDQPPYLNRRSETAEAVNCLNHGVAGEADRIDLAAPSPPFQFVAGNDNPVALPASVVMVSDSLVTVPVYDSSGGGPPNNPVQIIGFVQLFLAPQGLATPVASGHMRTTVINLAGCGTGATGQPILGNGASPVAVRLITPP